MRPTIILAMMLAIAGAVHAEAPSLRATLGAWRLTEVGGKVGCTLRLTDQPSIGGLEVKAPLACRGAFPALKEVSTWSFDADGTMVFSDPSRRRIVEFHASGHSYDAATPEGKTWRLEPVQPARAPAPPMSGAFRLTDAKGTDLCDLSLQPEIFGGSGSIRVVSCGPTWADKGFAAWSLKDGHLTLLDRRRKPILVLTAGDGGAFVTADAAAFAISLVRP